MSKVIFAGFNEERSGALWREMVAATAKNMTDPYLRAMFTFLLAISNPGPSQNHSGTSLEDVLDEDILTSDKVGYSCLHLPDAKLIQVSIPRSSFTFVFFMEMRVSFSISSYHMCI